MVLAGQVEEREGFERSPLSEMVCTVTVKTFHTGNRWAEMGPFDLREEVGQACSEVETRGACGGEM